MTTRYFASESWAMVMLSDWINSFVMRLKQQGKHITVLCDCLLRKGVTGILIHFDASHNPLVEIRVEGM